MYMYKSSYWQVDLNLSLQISNQNPMQTLSKKEIKKKSKIFQLKTLVK